jgi:hypothetical protein
MASKIISLEKLTIQPRDVVCIRVGRNSKPGDVARLMRRTAAWQQLLTDDLKAMMIIVPHDFEVQHLRQDQNGKLTQVNDGTVPAAKPLKRRGESARADARSVNFQSGICRKCGCTDLDCSGCVKRTGFPCRWANASHTLCSACV